jgi:hypothetical protein
VRDLNLARALPDDHVASIAKTALYAATIDRLRNTPYAGSRLCSFHPDSIGILMNIAILGWGSLIWCPVGLRNALMSMLWCGLV